MKPSKKEVAQLQTLNDSVANLIFGSEGQLNIFYLIFQHFVQIFF